jgi:hypothetical protein
MKNEPKYNVNDQIRFMIGSRIHEGKIIKIHETGFEVESDEKQYLVHYHKILEKITN